MKKFAALILAFLMLLSLCACSGGSGSGSAVNDYLDAVSKAKRELNSIGSEAYKKGSLPTGALNRVDPLHRKVCDLYFEAKKDPNYGSAISGIDSAYNALYKAVFDTSMLKTLPTGYQTVYLSKITDLQQAIIDLKIEMSKNK